MMDPRSGAPNTASRWYPDIMKVATNSPACTSMKTFAPLAPSSFFTEGPARANDSRAFRGRHVSELEPA